MHLPELARTLSAASTTLPEREVTGVTHNAQWAEPGCVFVAIKGERSDGHDYAQQAAAAGAIAVVGERENTELDGLPYLQVGNARAALAQAAAALTGHPARQLKTVGVTGTDGKTSTSWMVAYLLRACGTPAGLLSTVGYSLEDGQLHQFPSHFTTPEAPQVHQLLAEMVQAGTQAAVVEASSHALALHRLDGIDWDVAIWTQLTREHLDFHGDTEGYFTAKKVLIERARHAILNADDPWTVRLSGLAATEVTYGTAAGATWEFSNLREQVAGITFDLACPDGQLEVFLPMVGAYNVYNAVAAMAAAHRLGIRASRAAEAFAVFPGIPARMERLLPREGEADDVHVVIDFAHTTLGLEGALRALRPLAGGELWVVVGSAGGNRDPGKRRPMGEVATRLADHTVFTEEDHRTTPLWEILHEMERGARGEFDESEARDQDGAVSRGSYVSIPLRSDAIRHAVTTAQPGALILLAGKGTEETMERGSQLEPYSEEAQARAALAARAQATREQRPIQP